MLYGQHHYGYVINVAVVIKYKHEYAFMQLLNVPFQSARALLLLLLVLLWMLLPLLTWWTFICGDAAVYQFFISFRIANTVWAQQQHGITNS